MEKERVQALRTQKGRRGGIVTAKAIEMDANGEYCSGEGAERR